MSSVCKGGDIGHGLMQCAAAGPVQHSALSDNNTRPATVRGDAFRDRGVRAWRSFTPGNMRLDREGGFGQRTCSHSLFSRNQGLKRRRFFPHSENARSSRVVRVAPSHPHFSQFGRVPAVLGSGPRLQIGTPVVQNSFRHTKRNGPGGGFLAGHGQADFSASGILRTHQKPSGPIFAHRPSLCLFSAPFLPKISPACGRSLSANRGARSLAVRMFICFPCTRSRPSTENALGTSFLRRSPPNMGSARLCWCSAVRTSRSVSAGYSPRCMT